MNRWPTSEVELAAVVVRWLVDYGWDVYQEVEYSRGDSRADIVAVQGKIVWVIETKRSRSLALLGQALDWSYFAHYVSAAYPRTRYRAAETRAVFALAKATGIGLLEVTKSNIVEVVEPNLHRTAKVQYLQNVLRPEHKTFAEAGNADGKRWTPFQGTCEEIRKYVGSNPGCSLKQLVDSIKHHYRTPSSAKCCIARWAEVGLITGVELRRDGTRLEFFPI